MSIENGTNGDRKKKDKSILNKTWKKVVAIATGTAVGAAGGYLAAGALSKESSNAYNAGGGSTYDW